MADQMRCLGFDFTEEGSFERFLEHYWEQKTVLDLTAGLYLRLDAGAGIQCVLSMDRDTQEVLDWDMHFASPLRSGCCLDGELSLDPAGQSGTLRVLMDPGGEELPLTASVPLLASWEDRDIGAPGLIQVAAYAERISLLGDAESFHGDPEDNTARFTGTVTAAERLTNPWSRKDFLHLTVSCRGFSLDVLADAEELPRLPARGTLITADAVLTAQVESGVTE